MFQLIKFPLKASHRRQKKVVLFVPPLGPYLLMNFSNPFPVRHSLIPFLHSFLAIYCMIVVTFCLLVLFALILSMIFFSQQKKTVCSNATDITLMLANVFNKLPRVVPFGPLSSRPNKNANLIKWNMLSGKKTAMKSYGISWACKALNQFSWDGIRSVFVWVKDIFLECEPMLIVHMS